jgi:ABC-type sugar transport system ATPase subunit
MPVAIPTATGSAPVAGSLPFVQFKVITKHFGGVTALEGVTLDITAGECHCLMGENGAGKSTLGKILAGIHQPDSGEIVLDGRAVRFRTPADALAAGVGMVHQELAFCPDLSVAENMCMGALPKRLQGWAVDHGEMASRAQRMLVRIGVELDVTLPMSALSTAQEQMVQIATAVGRDARLIVFDEPTSSLSELDTRRLLGLIGGLKEQGVTIVYVSHRMPEVFSLADRITVLRDGKFVGTITRAEASEGRVVQMMIGRTVEATTPKHVGRPAGDVALSVNKLSSPRRFADVSFQVKAGEVVGFAGLVGSGRSEIANAIFGLDRQATGSVTINGQPLKLGRIDLAKAAGLGLVPEDRKRQGLVLGMSCLENFTLAMLERLTRLGLLRHGESRVRAGRYFEQMRLRTPSMDAAVGNLSGGNQQKVALAKWLGRDCRVLIVDEPTRGVDVGAKATIRDILDELACNGVAIVMISSELPELLGLATRVLVMREGKLVAEVPRGEATQDRLMHLMAGTAG